MKKIFSVLLAMSFSFAFANNNPPVFEETEENECRIAIAAPFAASEQFIQGADKETAQEDGQPEAPLMSCYEGCEDENCPHQRDEEVSFACKDDCEDGKCEGNRMEKDPDLAFLPPQSICRKPAPSYSERASYMSWKRYKANFGMEKVFIKFPHSPSITQTSTLLTAYAYDHGITYSLTGYYPPMGNIMPLAWFDEIVFNISHFPFTCLNHVIFQHPSGDWILDYVAHDYIQDLIIKTRCVVTPFNAYTIQCVKPNGARDHFDYFLDSFWIKCDCGH